MHYVIGEGTRGAEKLELSSKNLDSTPAPKQKKNSSNHLYPLVILEKMTLYKLKFMLIISYL